MNNDAVKVEKKAAPYGALTVAAKVLTFIKVVCLLSAFLDHPLRRFLHGFAFYGIEFSWNVLSNFIKSTAVFIVLLIAAAAAGIFLLVFVFYPKEDNWVNNVFTVINAVDLIGFAVTAIFWNCSAFVVIGLFFSALCTACAVVKSVVFRKTEEKYVSRPVKVVCVVLAALFVLALALGIVVNKSAKKVLYTEKYAQGGDELTVRYYPYNRVDYSYDSDDIHTGGRAEFVSENRAEYQDDSLIHFGKIFHFTLIFDGDTVTLIDPESGEEYGPFTLISSTKDGK